MNLVDRNTSVDDGGLDSLLLNHGLDVLVHMVVDALACDGGICGRSVLDLANGAAVLELSLLGG